MKKVFLFMAGLLLVGAANAQTKEELKAQKAAIKDAESLVKKAKTTYESSIPNPQYGRKETDFAKLDGALDLINQAMTNQYVKDNKDTWQAAADINYEYYKKLENEAKADESVKPKYIECSAKVAQYAAKYDSLLNLDSKVKDAEKTAMHIRYQQMAANPCLQLLQAAQNYSNSDDQAELKLGAQYSDLFLNLMEKSSLMKDFTNENLDDWKTYAKAFRAQSYFNIEGTPESKIVEAYNALIDTKYKTVAYQSLANYYSKNNNAAKQNEYLQLGIDALKGDAENANLRANFAAMLMQNLFQAKDKDGFQKVANLIKEEMGDSENAINAYLMEGQMLFEDQKFVEAEKVFMSAKDKFPDEPKCLLMAARCAWMKAQVDGSKKPDMDHAIDMFKQLEKENPSDPDLWGESLYILYNNTQQPKLAAPYKKYYKAI